MAEAFVKYYHSLTNIKVCIDCLHIKYHFYLNNSYIWHNWDINENCCHITLTQLANKVDEWIGYISALFRISGAWERQY